MRAIIQRVTSSSVEVDKKIIGSIEYGFLVLLAIHKDDLENKIPKIVDKIINLRIFEDEHDKMNKSLLDVCGEVLLVSQFTLYGNTEKGRRPSFIDSAKGEKASDYYKKVIKEFRAKGVKTETGSFGEMMNVKLVNNGPTTIIIDI